ncbi:hypothetical protein ABIF63_004038 [Bradyrhizobium japonicum]|uniref:Uncharacterized protein n=1 Tax=Bradyrhizobium japonicum TaxID=375 RepID=A0ABV2RSS3_BRAJP|nr:hypothetical protein [Bradyrhizobium japonicum]UQD96814.1 hypothetical protein JEY30_35550 [Bradyrhizobium japonicum]WLB16897.1 hypothetical protein QIH95_33420 [Bradyrhizobium japonicum]
MPTEDCPANFSISFLFGMRQLAGRSAAVPDQNITRTLSAVGLRRRGRGFRPRRDPDLPSVVGAEHHGCAHGPHACATVAFLAQEAQIDEPAGSDAIFARRLDLFQPDGNRVVLNRGIVDQCLEIIDPGIASDSLDRQQAELAAMGDLGGVDAQRVGKSGVAERVEHDVRRREWLACAPALWCRAARGCKARTGGPESAFEILVSLSLPGCWPAWHVTFMTKYKPILHGDELAAAITAEADATFARSGKFARRARKRAKQTEAVRKAKARARAKEWRSKNDGQGRPETVDVAMAMLRSFLRQFAIDETFATAMNKQEQNLIAGMLLDLLKQGYSQDQIVLVCKRYCQRVDAEDAIQGAVNDE